MSLGYFASRMLGGFVPEKPPEDTWGVVPPGGKTYDEMPYDMEKVSRNSEKAADDILASMNIIYPEEARPYSPQQRPQPLNGRPRAARIPVSAPSASSERDDYEYWDEY